MLSTSPGPRRPLLPIAVSEWFVSQPRLCAECDERSLEERGYSYVPRATLIPFISRCLEHRSPLQTFPNWTPTSRGPAESQATLPDREGESLAFAEASISLLDDDGRFIRELGELLQSLGMTTAKGRLRRADLVELLTRRAEGRYEHPELDRILTCNTRAARALSSIGSDRGCLHPAVAIALVRALRDAPVAQQLCLPQSPRATAYPALDKALRTGHSATAAAKMVGVSVQTALSRAADLGIESGKRPKLLTEDARQRVLALLQDARSHATVANETSLSLSTVYRIAREGAVQLDELRKKRSIVEVETKVAEWQNLASSHPLAARTELRAIAPALYTWLYRNAREQFAELAPLAKPGGERNACRRTDLTVRQAGARAPEGADFALARRLEEVAKTVASNGGRRLTHTALLDKAGRNRLHVAGQSAARRLDELSETVQDFVRRRVEDAAHRLVERGLPLLEWRLIKESGLRAKSVVESDINVEADARKVLEKLIQKTCNE